MEGNVSGVFPFSEWVKVLANFDPSRSLIDPGVDPRSTIIRNLQEFLAVDLSSSDEEVERCFGDRLTLCAVEKLRAIGAQLFPKDPARRFCWEALALLRFTEIDEFWMMATRSYGVAFRSLDPGEHPYSPIWLYWYYVFVEPRERLATQVAWANSDE